MDAKIQQPILAIVSITWKVVYAHNLAEVTWNLRELTNLFVEFIHFLDMETGYKLHSGCVKGTSCSEGSKCGTSSETACKECNFEQCKAIAGKSNSKGFAYSGEKRLCRLCDESQFKNIQNKQTSNVENWGLYVKYGNLYILIFHQLLFFLFDR